MNSHKNARLTRLGRAHMIEQISRVGLEAAADHAGISTRRAKEWQRRFYEAGVAGLYDRSSRPHTSPRASPLATRERIVNLRRNLRLPYWEIARRTGVSPATAGRVCAQSGIAKLPPLEAVPLKCRYERKTPGELLHLDTKRLARFVRPGHRVTGRRQPTHNPGYHALHVAILESDSA